VLHELVAAEFRSIPVQFVRGMAIGTGARADLRACGNPMWVDAVALSLLLASVGQRYRDIKAGRLPASDREADYRPRQTLEATGRPRSAPTTRPELVVLRDAGRPHLHLCYPAIGAETAYLQFSAALPANWTVTTCANADHADSVEEMAAWYLSPLADRFGTPDLLGGWSMGGLVGLEAARQLIARGAAWQPSLVLVDSPPPQETTEERFQIGRLEGFCEFLWRSFGMSSFRPRQIDTGGDDQVGLRLLALALRHAKEDVPVEWLSEWLAGYRRQLRLLGTYQCSQPIRASGLLLIAELTQAQVEAWRRSLSDPLTIRKLGGGHFDLLRPPLVTDAANLLAAHYAQRRSRS
jgi:thioesterase domain-containing protein